MPTCICVDSIIPCPGVIDKEGADTVGVNSSWTITFRMMIATTHFFHGIKERVHVFIPLEFKHYRDTQPLWRMAFFSYLDWEWVQVTSDHVANHYTTLAHAFAATKASSLVHRQVLSIAPPTECSLAITLPSARLSNKGEATTCLWGSIRNVKVHPGSSDPTPPSKWNTWEEYLQSKPEFTPDQIVTEIAQNRLKIDRTVARILEMFNWYFTSRLVAVISHFEQWLGADNLG